MENQRILQEMLQNKHGIVRIIYDQHSGHMRIDAERLAKTISIGQFEIVRHSKFIALTQQSTAGWQTYLLRTKGITTHTLPLTEVDVEQQQIDIETTGELLTLQGHCVAISKEGATLIEMNDVPEVKTLKIYDNAGSILFQTEIFGENPREIMENKTACKQIKFYIGERPYFAIDGALFHAWRVLRKSPGTSLLFSIRFDGDQNTYNFCFNFDSGRPIEAPIVNSD